ncbi:MOSC domain-containing protein [Aquimarina mytili]|uniref:MOSC domain-containing protein n=1 Tax=Aquimarina mytili TaxID=874423 RepID=A0A937A2E2_9FLAO|nr:MOSC domain-containing protein [Aquimarina mytili]MBL0683149.1 MOSC domain-containing protein [Aquimarina mytili]
MKVVSTNIAEPKIISWSGKEVKTGIYKSPVNTSIYLDKEDVSGDHVIDKRYHGGIDKACYLYAIDHYPYWKEKYPDLDWNHGMFGENLTVAGFDEHTIKVGSIYKLGEAIVQISRPRQPCYKLGIRFGNQGIIKQFIDSLLSGVYVRVLKSGFVRVHDEFIIEEENFAGITIAELNTLMFHFEEEKHTELLNKALNDPLVSDSDKKYFKKQN